MNIPSVPKTKEELIALIESLPICKGCGWRICECLELLDGSPEDEDEDED